MQVKVIWEFLYYSYNFSVSLKKKILKGETSPKNSSLGHFYTQENMNRIKNKMPKRKPSRRWAKPLREIQNLTEWRDI